MKMPFPGLILLGLELKVQMEEEHLKLLLKRRRRNLTHKLIDMAES